MSRNNTKSPGRWGAALRLAVRESRAGLKGFRIFAAALMLGVAAIAGVGSLSAAFQQGLQDEKLRLLGGDIEITTINQDFSPAVQSFFKRNGDVSSIIEGQLMAHGVDDARTSVVQLKAIDNAYPLAGALSLDPATLGIQAALASTVENGQPIWGAVADQALLDKLEIAPGGHIRIGDAVFSIRAVIKTEPDRASAGFFLGPRLITSRQAAGATGLLATSAMVNYAARIMLPGGDPARFEERLKETFPDQSWRIRSATQASAGLARLLKNLDVFLTMIGLGALVIGGVGAANAVRAYMEKKTPVIATLKCLGADGGFILKSYMLQILMVAGAAVLAGVLIGALAPLAVAGLFGALLPFEASVGVYPAALGEAALYGMLAAAAFAFWPLAAARRASAARLFRAIVTDNRERPGRRDFIILALLALAFAGLAVALAGERKFALIFIASGLAAYGALRFVSWLAVMLARRFWRPASPMARLAAASLTRPGAATASISVSLGLGLTLLAVISLIDVNLSREITRALPQKSPALFFSDIAYDDADRFDARLRALAPEAQVERFYMMRAGVALLNGKPVSEVEGAADSPWVRDNDWGVTTLPAIPETLGKIVDGTPWEGDYAGPPRLALSSWQAEALSLKPGDTMTLTISGRRIKADVAALFDQNWDSNGLNFVAIFAPGTLEAARPTSIGSLRTGDLEIESAVARALAKEFPQVAVIRVRDVIQTVTSIVQSIAFVIRALSGLTILAGTIVLLGAVAADFSRKMKDAMIMRAIGAPRRRILTAYWIEYAVLGAGPALAAAGLGLLGSWFIVAKRMDIDWRPAPEVLFLIISGSLAITMSIGLIAAMRALRTRPWSVLRSD